VPDEGLVGNGLRIGRWLPSPGSADPHPSGGAPEIDTTPIGTPEPDAPGPVIGPGDDPPRGRRALIGVVALTVLLLPVSVLGGLWDDDPTATGLPSTGQAPGSVTPSSGAPGATVPSVPAPSVSPSGVPEPGVGGNGGTPPATTHPPAVVVGTRIGLEPVTAAGFLVRHRDFVGRIDRIGPQSTALDRADSSFTARAGLSDARCVSFEAVNFPGFFLRHQNLVLRLNKRDDTPLFAADATFCPVAGLSGRGVSLRSANVRDHYLLHRNGQLLIAPVDGTTATRAAMTFAVRPALA
jgi:hypothetical protein